MADQRLTNFLVLFGTFFLGDVYIIDIDEALPCLPFNLPVDIKALQPNIIVSAGGTSFANPKEPVTTNVHQRIHSTSPNVPFTVFGDRHSAFQQFLASTTMPQASAVSDGQVLLEIYPQDVTSRKGQGQSIH